MNTQRLGETRIFFKEEFSHLGEDTSQKKFPSPPSTKREQKPKRIFFGNSSQSWMMLIEKL